MWDGTGMTYLKCNSQVTLKERGEAAPSKTMLWQSTS